MCGPLHQSFLWVERLLESPGGVGRGVLPRGQVLLLQDPQQRCRVEGSHQGNPPEAPPEGRPEVKAAKRPPQKLQTGCPGCPSEQAAAQVRPGGLG